MKSYIVNNTQIPEPSQTLSKAYIVEAQESTELVGSMVSQLYFFFVTFYLILFLKSVNIFEEYLILHTIRGHPDTT